MYFLLLYYPALFWTRYYWLLWYLKPNSLEIDSWLKSYENVSIVEDMSGMPGMCLPVACGGIGFDYRLAMGVPDFWVKILEQKDEDWDMDRLWHELSTSRLGEKRINYVESHDQALVGDKTFIFRMADKETYWHMDKNSETSSLYQPLLTQVLKPAPIPLAQ
ncbi:MAG: hypothetical protein A4E53_02446 [Pelotomaculum sp. PtaB.Bin104]|nr:MAG: hypothetical protein A4E53_02446 [Pelotomaculum sp. PtaB.Bin104]